MLSTSNFAFKSYKNKNKIYTTHKAQKDAAQTSKQKKKEKTQNKNYEFQEECQQ